MTDPTTANIFRIFGTIESGQCILVLDEAEKIDQEREMMSILKTGYENGKKVQRISHLGKQEHFHTFGLKLMLAERTPSQLSARGVMERTFVIPSYRGRPQLDIKEIKIAQDNPIKNELLFIRKLLLVYRLLNCNTGFAEIETGLEGETRNCASHCYSFSTRANLKEGLKRHWRCCLTTKTTERPILLRGMFWRWLLNF